MNSATPARTTATADASEAAAASSDETLGFAGTIAIDGPSGSGKSTVARRLASRLGVSYLDTGAMYRAVTWAVLQADVDPADATNVAQVAVGSELVVSTDPAAQSCAVDGVDVTWAIRGAQVTQAVSAVAANPEVRQGLVAHQQAVIADAPRGIVVEGRDIAGVVAPDAVLKVYLTASPEARARRRHGDSATGTTPDVADTELAAVAQDLHRRDELDSTRATDPLRVADSAVVLDTTDLGIDAVVDHLVELHAVALQAATLTPRPTAAPHAAPSKAVSPKAESA